MKRMLKKILDSLFGKSVDEQEKEYLEKWGYPDEDVVFTDRSGRMSRIIGKNTFLKQIELHKKIDWKCKKRK